MSTIKANGWQRTDGTIQNTALQVVQATMTSQWWSTSDQYQDVGGLVLNITPSSTTSKILLMITVQLSHVDSNTGHIRLFRNDTPIFYGDVLGSFEQTLFTCRISGSDGGNSDSNQINPYSAYFLDSPGSPNTLSTLTYQIKGRARAGTNFFINRSGQYNYSDNNMGAVASSLTAIEIQA